MRKLIDELNFHQKLYDAGKPEISDSEWDKKYFKLQEMEKESGVIYPDSPTQSISFTSVTNLPKAIHSHLMLSLQKVKSVKEVKDFIGTKPYLAMAKLDGLTLTLTYENGKLTKMETRGDGRIGESVIHNAIAVKSIPLNIPFKDTLIVDGELLCSYKNFEPFKEEYANPRNFAAGSIRLLDAKECAKRNLDFICWDVVKGFNDRLLSTKLEKVKNLGFNIVPYCYFDHIEKDIIEIKNASEDYPIDGAVFKYDEVEYYYSLGHTAHHFSGGLAFKFLDNSKTSHLLNIEWGLGRTGVLTPIAIFEEVNLEGTTVSRASLHNISIMKEILGKRPFIGEEVEIIKSNMIIPQIIDANTEGTGMPLLIPQCCPVCGGEVEIRNDNGRDVLYCVNDNCEGKIVSQIVHYCSKKGLDIKGLSEATIEKLMNYGWVNNIYDIYNLKEHRLEWSKKQGFGLKSVDNILEAIEKSKKTSLEKFIAALGISLIGTNVAKEISKNVKTYKNFRELIDLKFDFSQWEGFGEAKTKKLLKFDYSEADKLVKLFTFEEEKPKIIANGLNNLTIVITGTLETFKNRTEIINFIAANGGKVSSSVSKNTNYLVCNDKNSTSTKARKAQELGIKIISEKELKNLCF